MRRIRARAGDLSNGKKIAALINGGTASLAEVVAGALKDNHRATLIGTRSFGEGSVATTIPLGAGKGALHLAIGHYVTPSGSVIEGNGGHIAGVVLNKRVQHIPERVYRWL